jgi:hypothetical protein
MKSKKVIDWIKFNNIKENSVNLSALDGLKRRNIILRKTIKYSIVFGFLGYATFYYFKEYDLVIADGGRTFINRLNSLPNKKSTFKDSHKLLCLEYLDNKVKKMQN